MPRFNGVAGHAAQTRRSLLLSIRIAHPNMSEVLPLPLAGEIVADARCFPRIRRSLLMLHHRTYCPLTHLTSRQGDLGTVSQHGFRR